MHRLKNLSREGTRELPVEPVVRAVVCNRGRAGPEEVQNEAGMPPIWALHIERIKKARDMRPTWVARVALLLKSLEDPEFVSSLVGLFGGDYLYGHISLFPSVSVRKT